MIIGVDLDDVLMDTFPAFLAFCNQRYNEQFRVEQFVSFRYYGVWGLTKEQGRARFIEFDSSESKKSIPPMPGAKEMIARLAQVHELHIITARPQEIAEGTHQWIEQHFPEVFTDVHFCSKNGGADYHRPKPLVCKELGAMLHIEDHPETAEQCAKEGIHVYLFDQPWNRHEFQETPLLAGGIFRFKGWKDEILRTLLE